MKEIKEYLLKLHFEYALSYSGLRGEKFKNLEIENKAKILAIIKDLETARYTQKAKLREKINILASEIEVVNSVLINQNGKLHKSAVFVHRFEKDAKETASLLKALSSPFSEEVAVPCPPVFRDSLVFYSKKNEITGILNFCFECIRIKNEMGEDLNVGYQVFEQLADELINVGHPINKNE